MRVFQAAPPSRQPIFSLHSTYSLLQRPRHLVSQGLFPWYLVTLFFPNILKFNFLDVHKHLKIILTIAIPEMHFCEIQGQFALPIKEWKGGFGKVIRETEHS